MAAINSVQYMADLIAETVRSLHKSPSWRAGRPLKDHRGECDCPRSLAGCVERQGWPSNSELGARNPDNEGHARSPRRRVDPTHDLRTTYAHGCRCNACRQANTAYQRQYRPAPQRVVEPRGSESDRTTPHEP